MTDFLAEVTALARDLVAIDSRSFVSNVNSNPQSAAIVRAVIGLSHALNIPIIAEGVETESERDFLRDEGCREIQGYLIGRPQPIADYADVTRGAAERLFDLAVAADPARRRVSTDGS